MKRNLLVSVLRTALALVGWTFCTAYAQTSNPSGPRFTLQGPAEQSASPVIKDALNRPCLDIEAASRAHTVNPRLFDHVVSIKNRCARPIKVKVCYFNSEDCRSADLGSNQRQDLILGTMANVTSFRYSIGQR